MPIEDFLVDFYSKNTDQEIDQVKIDSIVDYYGGDNVSMVNDLYEKYDTGNINDDKILKIQKYYSLDLPKQEEVDVQETEVVSVDDVAEEPVVQETEIIEKEPIAREQPKHVSIDKIQGKFEEDDVLKNLNNFYADDIKSGLISFDTSGGMRDEITVTTPSGETVIPLNSDFNTTSGFSSLPGKEYTKYGEDGSYIDDRESFGKQSYNNLIKTIDSARIKSTPEQKALFQYNDDLGYEAQTGTYPDIKAVTQEKVYFPYGSRASENQEEISSPATTSQTFDMVNMVKTLAVQNLINIEKTLNKEQKGFDRSTSTTTPGLAEMDPETNYDNIKEKTYQDYVAASKKLNIPYTPLDEGFTAIWGIVKQQAINESKPEERYKKYKEQNTNIKELDTEQEDKRLANWKSNLTTEELGKADNFKNIIETQNKLKTVNERLKSASNSTGNESLVNQKLELETNLKALTETFNTKYKESSSRDINGFWINNRPAVSDEEKERLNKVYKNSTTNAENTLKNSQKSTLTPQQILENQTNDATLEKLRTLQIGRDQKVRIRFDEEDIKDQEVTEISVIPDQFKQNKKPIKALLASGKLTPKDIKSGYIDVSYTDIIEMGLNTEDFEGAIDQLGLSFKKGETGKEISDISFSDGGFMSAKDIKDFKQFERQYYSELMNEQALMDFTYLNKDLAKMETVYDKNYTGIGVLDHLIGGGGTFIQSAAGAISEMGDGTAQDREKVESFLGGLSETSTRADINAADKIIKNYNNSEYVAKNNMQIKLTNEQKENLDQSLGEAIYSGTGEFVPMVLELAAIDLATGGALGPAGVAKAFPRMGKIFQHILNAGIEEVKMQTLFDMPPTGGAAFYTFGAITKNMIKLKGPLARFQGIFDKIMVSGVSGVGASEFSKVSEAVYEDLMNEKTFRQSMNEAYGDLDEVQKRMIVSLGNFSMLGIHHLKKVDFMSTKAKYDLMDAIEIKASNINDKAAAERGEYITNEKGEEVLNKEFKSIEEKEKYLTESEKSNLNQYSTDFSMLSQYALNESMSNELDPKQTDQATFEKNFNKRYMDPVNRVLKSFDPEYKAPKILFGNSSKNPSFRENFRSGKNSTAEITNDGSRMYFDLKYYTPGKALHEITHLGLQTYYKNNPEAKFRMLERFDKMFKDVDVDLFLSGEAGEVKLTGKQTKKLVEEGYKERSSEERMEEYLSFMVEGLSNPRAYYQNPRIMSGKLAEMRNYFKDVFKEMGANNIEPPQTAYDLIDLLASMGQSARQGTKIQNKFQTFMAALSDENTSFLNSVNIEAFKMAPERTLPENKYREAASKEMASKDLTKEVEGVEKEKVETMVNKVANRAFTKFYKGIPINVREKAGLDRKTYLESAKTELQEIAREFDPNKKDKDGNPIAFDRFMANRGMQRMNSLATRLGVESAEKPTSKRLGQERAEGEKEFDIKSEDATPEDALIASQESSFTDRKGITVSKKLGNKADKVVAEIKRKIPVEKELQDKFLEDKTYKSLKDLAAKETQEMFGIKPKPGNLTKSDVKNAQIFINNNPDLFYGLLPKQHTTKRVNVGTSKEPKYVTRPDKATGVQDVLLNAFYNKGTRKDNLTPWTKKPARDVKTSEFLELFGITERGNSNLYVKNSNVSSRIKALVEQTGRIITNQTVREVLPEARLVGEGRDKTMASIDLTKTLEKAFKQIKNTGKLNKKELLKGVTLDWEIKAIEDLSERRFKVAIDNDIIKLSELEKLTTLDLEGDVRFFNEAALETIALKEGISIPEARERYMGEVVSLIKNGKELKASIKGTTYRSAKERAEPKNFKKSKPYYIDFIERLIPKGSSFSELPASIQKMIMTTIGMGDHKGRTNGRKFTFKEYNIKDGNYIDLLEAVYDIKEASLKGKGPSIDSFASDINIPSPTASKLKASNAEIKSTNIIDFQAEAAKAILGRGQFNVDAVLDANKAALQNVYNSAKEVVKNAKNPIEALDNMIDLMLDQTNRSIGGIKGLAGVESITMEGMRGSNPKRNKELHNEHLTELFTMTKDFGKMMERFIKGEQSEASVDLQLKRMVEDYNQGVISEARREIKDFDGSSIRTYEDNLVFLGKDATKQIPLRESTFAEAENMAEVIRNNATKTMLDRIARTPYRKLTLAGVLTKQRQMNKTEYQKLKNENIEVVKEASMSSKDLTQSEMLNELNKRDKAFRLGNERDKTVKKIEVDFDALGISKNEAKVQWLIDKASEGYNDFNFANDAKSNVKAVRDILEQLDVKSQVQKTYASKDLSGDFNKIIEESTGIDKFKVYSDIKAQVRGASAKRQKFFIPPSAEDMLGLLYTTLGKGKKGEAQLDFYKENIFDPYTRAMENLSTDRVNLMSDFKALKKQLDVPKDLAKTTESGFTNEQATRVYLWNKMGEKIPGLSKTDLKELNDIIEKDPKLKAFADQILTITKGDGYSTPKEAWAVGTITTDLIDILNTKKRGKYLETWNQNTGEIFSKDNLNKLEAAYGPKYREAMENMLARMKSGSNRLSGGNKLSNNVLDYINNSTGAIMFFNTRSAVLQTISAANFMNWGFNNPYNAGKAFANQPQYWKDFSKLMNSDYLIDRRNGLKLNINESEIANAAKTSKNKAKAALNYILEKGYLPTKYADSFAIASGGATFYRNRIKDLVRNEGKTNAEAEVIAMKEFRQVSETSQQSSDPSKISSQQSSDLGRVVLQFANTPMQYARIQKRAVQDIVNGRGDLKTNISKIAYYAFAQNLLFNALQNGLFALGFGDTDIDEKEEKSIVRTANGMMDSILRGLGFAGVTVQVLKNLGIDIYDRSKKDRPEYGDAYKKLLDFSPAIKSKLGKFSSAGYPFETKKKRAEVFDKGFSLDNPAYESMAKVITGTTNLPLDRLYSKVNNLKAASDEETETWQSIAMVLGWPEWQIKGRQNYVEVPKTEEEKIKIKEERSKTRLKAAKGSTDFKTLKKLNKQEQLRILKNLGIGKQRMRKYKNLKEADLIEEIIKRNKRKEQ